MLLILEPMYHSQQKVLDSKRTITPTTIVEEYLDSYSNKVWLILAPMGNVKIEYHLLVDMPPTSDLMFPGLPKTAIENLPSYVLDVYLA